MAALRKIISGFSSLTLNIAKTAPTQQACGQCQGLLSKVMSPWQPTSQVRTRYVDWRMWRDEKRRRLAKEHGQDRIRYVALRKNKLIPKEFRDQVVKEINEKFPRDAHPSRIHNRCVITSRGRGLMQRWRVSRIIWRHLADYNQMSGITRSRW